MKHNNSWVKSVVVAVASAVMLSSCVTSYDRSGRPIQTVDPVAATVGAVLIGAIAYSAGNDDRDRYRHHGHRTHRPHRYNHCR